MSIASKYNDKYQVHTYIYIHTYYAMYSCMYVASGLFSRNISIGWEHSGGALGIFKSQFS